MTLMTTLHITAPVSDIEAFKSGYAANAETRQKGGVRGEQLRRSVNGDSVVVIDLDFGSPAEAEAFLNVLRTEVWTDNPVLTGTPQATILEPLAV